MRIEVPTSLEDIKISQLIKWNEATEMYSDTLLPFKMVSIFCNIDIEDVIKIPIAELNEIIKTLNNTITNESEFKDRFILNGTTYGFIPNFDEFTTAEYIDLDTYYDSDPLRLMMVMFRPIVSTFKNMYNIEDYKGTDGFEKMLDAPASALLGAKVFFWNLRNELVKHIPTYLKQRMTQQQIIDSEKNGVGISRLMQLLKETDLSTMKFTN